MSLPPTDSERDPGDDPGHLAVLLISGSLRADSVNTAVVRTLATRPPARVRARIYEGLGELPHFNPDDDEEGQPVHPRVRELREQLASADAILFSTPEYAGAMPGSFKNLLDWTVGGGETYGKPVAWINASSRNDPDAAGKAHESLRTVLTYTGTEIVEDACRRVTVPRSAIEDGEVVDERVRASLFQALDALVNHAGGRGRRSGG